MHAAGVVCIVLMAGTAAWVIWSTVAPAWLQMRADFLRAFTSPAASSEPHSEASTPLRSVEAAAEPTLSVTA
jgi:hypothetical protein